MTDVRAVFEEQVAAELARRPELAAQVDAVLQVEIAGAGGGIWAIDLTRAHAPPSVVAGAHVGPAVRITIAHDDFVDLVTGNQRWTDAYVRGKIDVRGNLVTALKLRTLFAAVDAAG
jgi:hypothetical protein